MINRRAVVVLGTVECMPEGHGSTLFSTSFEHSYHWHAVSAPATLFTGTLH